MAKGKDKSTSKSKDKSAKKGKKKSKNEQKQDDALLEVSDLEKVEELPPDIRPVKILIEGYEQVSPLFLSSDVNTEVYYLDTCLGTSEKVPVTDDVKIQVEHEFILNCDVNSRHEIDHLISNPVIFKVYLSQGTVDPLLAISKKEESFDLAQGDYNMSLQSAADLFEAFTERKVNRSLLGIKEEEKPPPKKPQKPNKKGKQKKGSGSKRSSTKDSKSSKESVAKVEEKKVGPYLVGVGILDLLPLFLGQDHIHETIPLYPSFNKCLDSRMVPGKLLPRIIVHVQLDNRWTLMDNKSVNILNFSVESMYNIPNAMTPEMEYSTCAFLPCVNSPLEPVIFKDGVHKTEKNIRSFKYWPELHKTEDEQSAAKYKFDCDVNNILNFDEINLDVMNDDKPRVEWNYISRKYLGEEGISFFSTQLNKYRTLGLEIFIAKAKETHKEKEDQKSSNKSDYSSPIKKATAPPEMDYLHLMTLVDIGPLLYPGVSKVRVACPVTTFHEFELLEKTGISQSFFVPKKISGETGGRSPKTKTPKSGKSSKKTKSNKTKSSKASKKSKASSKKTKGSSKKSKGSSKSSKSKKSGKNAEGKDLRDTLPPPPPPPPEPSLKVYNENGERTFIIVEIELFKPMVPKRKIEDLTEELQRLIPSRPQLPKTVITSQFAQQLYKETIHRLTEDLNHHYVQYLSELEKCKCICSEDNPKETTDFLTYLRKTGVYQTYLNSLTKVTAIIINDKYNFNGTCDKDNKDYQNFISEVYVDLVSQMNSVLNEIVTYGMEPPAVGNLTALDAFLLYAKEASEVNADALADRYYLERICCGNSNDVYWFDYAIFCMETGEYTKAMECVKETLSINSTHKYGLLLYGLILSQKEEYEDAETCLLNMMIQYQRWAEGWMVLYLFYHHIKVSEGEQVGLEMAKRYADEIRPKDYFLDTDDLAWTAAICPEDIYTRTAVLLIKLRCFQFVDILLSIGILQKNKLSEYLFAVVCYYRREYKSALALVTESERMHGLDYGTGGLKGHCLLALGRIHEAKNMYSYVLESFNRPDDVHLIYVNMSVALEALGSLQEARKMTLLACKYSPTPYTWLAAGLIYYKLRDLLSAEACMNEANLCDNRLPETWAYLTIVNSELGRDTEASLCYRQAIKNKLVDEELLAKINKVMRINK